MNGYTKPVRLALEVEAQMLESVAELDTRGVERELAFATPSLDINNTRTLRWMAALCERRVADLERS